MKLKLKDQVQVTTGKDKGKKGAITKILRKQNKIVVEKVNIRTKHIKKTTEKAGSRTGVIIRLKRSRGAIASVKAMP